MQDQLKRTGVLRLLVAISIGMLSITKVCAQDELYINSLSNGHVYDFDKIINKETRLALEKKMASFEATYGRRLIFITVVDNNKSEMDDSLFDAKTTGMLDLFWQSSNSGTKEVFLIVLSLNTGNLSAKVYSSDKGRDGVMIAETSAILDQEMVPRCKEEKYSEGIAVSINRILAEWK